MTASAGPGASPIAARFTDVSKQYTLDEVSVQALHGVNFTIERGGFTVLCGPSGSGKSTILHLLGCLDTPTRGRIEIAGVDVGALSDIERSNFRARHIGFVFQSFNLIPVLTTLENVEYPLQLTMPDRNERSRRARQYLEAVGLGRKLDRRPSQLSGGERQRVAVARAMAKEPALVLADEPTANLDRKTGAELISLMRRLQHEHHVTFVFSSHDAQLIDDADVCLPVEDGKLVAPHARSLAQTELSR